MSGRRPLTPIAGGAILALRDRTAGQMIADAGLSSPTLADRGRVELRYTGTYAALAVLCACLAIFAGWITAHGEVGSVNSKLDWIARNLPWLGWFFVIYLAGLAGIYSWRAIDRRPVLLLDETGLYDLRRGSVVLPWASLQRAFKVGRGPIPWGWVALQFDRDLGIRRVFDIPQITAVTYFQSTATIWVGALNISPQEFLDHVRRLAPHVALESAAPTSS